MEGGLWSQKGHFAPVQRAIYTGTAIPLISEVKGNKGWFFCKRAGLVKTKRVDNALLLFYSLQTRNYFTDKHDAWAPPAESSVGTVATATGI